MAGISHTFLRLKTTANEACDIAVSGSGFIKATGFHSEIFHDYLTIGGDQISGADYDLAQAGLPVQDGASIAWHSDGSVQASGFEVCGAPCEVTRTSNPAPKP